MPGPTSSTTIQRPDLGAVVYEYAMGAAARGFVGLRALPLFPVALQSADYPIIPAEALLKIPNNKRAPKAGYHRTDWQFETGTFSCQEYGEEGVLDDSERKKYEGIFPALQLEQITVRRAEKINLLAQEKRIADMIFNTSNFTVHDVTNEWDDKTNATPIDDVKDGKETVRLATGVEPNALIINKSVFNNLLRCEQITGELQYTEPITRQPFEAQRRIVAEMFGLAELLVAGAVHDSAAKGQAASIGNLWSNEYGMLCRIAMDSEDLEEPCLGRTMLWTEDSPENAIVEQYRQEEVRSDVFRVRHSTDEVFIMSASGYLLGNLTT